MRWDRRRGRRRLGIPPSRARAKAPRGVERPQGRRTSEPPAVFPVGFFGARHGLTPAQAAVAQRLLDRADSLRPIQDRRRWALRVAGVISSVKGGRVANSRWGSSMFHKRGALALWRHAPHIPARTTFRPGARRLTVESLRELNARGQAAAMARWGMDPSRPTRRQGG